MKYDVQCMYCELTKHDGVFYRKEDYEQLKEGNSVSHGICKSDVCLLEHAMKSSGVLDAEKELPTENKYLLEDIIRITESLL